MAAKLWLICDESGGKGRADKNEDFPGQVGVAVGVLVEDARCGPVSATLAQKLGPLRVPAGAKCHLADFAPADQPAVRQAVLETVRDEGLTLVYEAIHVQGFAAYHRDQLERERRLRSGRTSGVAPSGGGSPQLPRLHDELLAGVVSTGVAVVLETYGETAELSVALDQIDDDVLRSIHEQVGEILGDGTATLHVTGWDPRTKSVVRGQVEVKRIGEFASPVPFSPTIGVGGVDESLLLIPDVVSNSLVHHFAQRPSATVGARLMVVDALAGWMFQQFLRRCCSNAHADVTFPYRGGPTNSP